MLSPVAQHALDRGFPSDLTFKPVKAGEITLEESWLSFDQKAVVLHNNVCAFVGWPGTRAIVLMIDPKSDQQNIIELKIITTRVHHINEIQSGEVDDVFFSKGSLIFPCAEGTALEVLEAQLAGKKVVNAAAFWNGLRGQKVKKL